MQHDKVVDVWECGVFEAKDYSWLAASPDAIALVQTEDETLLAPVEIKTKVSHERIAKAEAIAARHNTLLTHCFVDDKIWNDCVEPDHRNQLMLQMFVLKLTLGKAGLPCSDGRILYIIFATATELQLNNFMESVHQRCHHLLKTFYLSTSIDDVMRSLSPALSHETREIFRTRWPFFNKMRHFVLTKYNPPMGFPATSLIKTPFQSLYNAMKGGLDYNTQQYCCINPSIKTKFETKYVLCLILAIVTNSWRA